jgi:hypothetical protein
VPQQTPVLQCTITKVGISDSEGTFAGVRGKHEVAPSGRVPPAKAERPLSVQSRDFREDAGRAPRHSSAAAKTGLILVHRAGRSVIAAAQLRGYDGGGAPAHYRHPGISALATAGSAR